MQPFHTTECSISQSFDGDGALYMYTRIWAHKPGEPTMHLSVEPATQSEWNLTEGEQIPEGSGRHVGAPGAPGLHFWSQLTANWAHEIHRDGCHTKAVSVATVAGDSAGPFGLHVGASGDFGAPLWSQKLTCLDQSCSSPVGAGKKH